MKVPQMVFVALRFFFVFFASVMSLYSTGDAENLNKGPVCRVIRHVYLALKSVVHIFVTLAGHRRLCYIKEGFYKIAGNMKYTHQEKCVGKMGWAAHYVFHKGLFLQWLSLLSLVHWTALM